MLSLRPYQASQIEEARNHLRAGKKSVLIQAPTGSGKTVEIAWILKSARDRGLNAWLILHRSELLEQSVRTLKEATGIQPGVIAAGHPVVPFFPVQVCMVGSIRSRAHRLKKPDLIVIDECHHQSAGTWANVRKMYPDATYIGATATPERLDGQGLGGWFEAMVLGPSVASLIRDGHLSRYRMFRADTKVDLSQVHTLAGEYNHRELSETLQKSSIIGDCVAEYRKHADGLRGIVFSYSISSSREVVEQFLSAGIPARHVDGDTPSDERRRAIDDFREGRVKIVSNCELFGEGVDIPAIEACFLLRPTQSLGLYLQQVGRALRPVPGKEAALIFDHAGNRVRHGYPDDEREWTLEGTLRREREAMRLDRQCRKCYSIQAPGCRVCKQCGYSFPVKEREVETEAGELREITQDEIAAQKEERRLALVRERGSAQTYEDLLALEKQRGYKSGWARHIFEARQSKLSKQADQFRPAQRSFGE